MMKKRLLPLLLLTISPGLLAQQLPGAGSQLRQLPPAPVAPPARPGIRIEETGAPAAPDAAATRVVVRQLLLTGNAVYDAPVLLAVARFTPGESLTLGDLQAMAARITEHYRGNGYFVARAYIPAQDVTGNVVAIAVSEGRYGQVTVRNPSRLTDAVPRRLLAGLDGGDAITLAPLESRLLMLSDVPGVKVSSTLVPGSVPGTSDLVVDVVPGRAVSGSVEADNAGNPYTGEVRVGATVNFNNPLGLGDVASLRVLTAGDGLAYGRASYQMPFGRSTIGAAYSRLEYELGEQFEALGAHGSADVASLYGVMPLIRSRDSNLYAGLAYEDRRFEDRIDLLSSVTHREARVLTASLYGNRQDGFGGGGANAFYAALSAGSLDILTPATRAADAGSARSHGSYSKLWINATRLQRVTDVFSLHGSLTAQFASKNLDSSEKFVLGGMDGIRAYPQGEAFGDEGVLASLEARLLLAGLSGHVPGDVHLLGFVDGGRVTVNRNPWFDGGNQRRLGGAGIGATWIDPGNFALRTYYAGKLGGEDALSAPDRSGRFWVQAIKYF
jgi:hemolysin activation/secretion protein